MRVSGDAVLHATPDRVYAALTDPAVLVSAVPGCESVDAVDDGFRVAATVAVASVAGTYDGEVRLLDGEPPGSFVLRAVGGGVPGTVDATVRVELSASGGDTLVTYDADATVGGMVSGVGQRMLAGAAGKLATEFLAGVDAALVGAPPAPPPAPAPVRVPEVEPVPAPRAYLPVVAAAAVGTAVGVAVGWLLGRRR